MLATISTQVWDAQGYIELDVLPGQTVGETRRRMNRVATLDGGAVVNDSGFSEADRTIDLKWKPSVEALEVLVDRLVRFYGRLNVSTRSGFYETAVEAYTPSDDESTLRLLVLSKLSA